MNKAASILLGIVTAISSHAVVNIDWFSSTGTITKSDDTNAPITWYAQLVWSNVNTPSAISATDPFSVLPTETVLLEQQLNNVNTTAGRVRSSSAPFDGADTLVNGFLYTRVFNVDYSSSDTVTLYGISQVTGNINNLFNGGLMITTSDPLTSNVHNPVVKVNQPYAAIPEPSSFALMVFGAAAFAWRRRRAA